MKKNQLFYHAIFIVVIVSIFMFLHTNNLTLARGSDFATQHVKFFDYYRQNFHKTHDLMPNITMNYGTTQDFANLYYYGYLNPFLLITLLFPKVTTYTFLKILPLLAILISYIFSYITLKKLSKDNTSDLKIYVFSTLVATSPVLITHFGTHLMFYYYYPIIVVSFYLITRIVDGKSSIPFSFTIASIFFTNFFFAIAIGVSQTLFAIMYLYHKQADKKLIYTTIKKMLYGYLIGIVMGAAAFIPQAYNIMHGGRVTSTLDLKTIIHPDLVNNMMISSYGFGLNFLIVFLWVLTIFNLKNKLVRYLGIVLAILLISNHAAIFLNIMQYNENRAYIYLVPFIIIYIYYLMNDKTIKFKLVSSLVSIIICGLYIYNNPLFNFEENSKQIIYIYILLIQLVMFILLSKNNLFNNKIGKALTILLVNLLVICNFTYFGYYKDKVYYQEQILTKKMKKFYDKEIGTDFYRTNNNVNMTAAINHYAPMLYTSIVNQYGVDLFNDYISISKRGSDRYVENYTYRNNILRTIYGVKKDLTTNKNYNARTFIYGVLDQDIYSFNKLNIASDNNNNLNLGRLLGLTNYSTDNNSTKIGSINTDKYFITSNKMPTNNTAYQKIELLKHTIKEEGTYYIETSATNENISYQRVCIKRFCTSIRNKTQYTDFPNKKAVFMIDTDDLKLNKPIYLRMHATAFNNTYSDYKIYFVPKKDLGNSNFIKTYNNKIEYNHSYEFEINMPTSGDLFTSIYYDDRFKIELIQNDKPNQKVDSKVVNGYFLGAKLEKGSYKIKISYDDTIKKIGIVVSIIGVIINIFYFIFILINNKRSNYKNK
ncbi:YfhO family protein [Mycoplasma sp. P36-A1]|uniref:YfhO family protein n=1 Tax=Mycoplasma sp. P36-A1 TaxID=3252900 RepID=UPI003C2F4908